MPLYALEGLAGHWQFLDTLIRLAASQEEKGSVSRLLNQNELERLKTALLAEADSKTRLAWLRAGNCDEWE